MSKTDPDHCSPSPLFIGGPTVCGQCGGTYNSLNGPCIHCTSIRPLPAEWAQPDALLRLSPAQFAFFNQQRQRVLAMIGALESTLAVLRSEAELLDGLIAAGFQRENPGPPNTSPPQNPNDEEDPA